MNNADMERTLVGICESCKEREIYDEMRTMPNNDVVCRHCYLVARRLKSDTDLEYEVTWQKRYYLTGITTQKASSELEALQLVQDRIGDFGRDEGSMHWDEDYASTDIYSCP